MTTSVTQADIEKLTRYEATFASARDGIRDRLAEIDAIREEIAHINKHMESNGHRGMRFHDPSSKKREGTLEECARMCAADSSCAAFSRATSVPDSKVGACGFSTSVDKVIWNDAYVTFAKTDSVVPRPSVVARYVRLVRTDGTRPLQVRTLAAFDEFGKRIQDAVHALSRPQGPEFGPQHLASDGATGFAQTNAEVGAYVQLDLRVERKVSQVYIVGRDGVRSIAPKESWYRGNNGSVSGDEFCRGAWGNGGVNKNLACLEGSTIADRRGSRTSVPCSDVMRRVTGRTGHWQYLCGPATLAGCTLVLTDARERTTFSTAITDSRPEYLIQTPPTPCGPAHIPGKCAEAQCCNVATMTCGTSAQDCGAQRMPGDAYHGPRAPPADAIEIAYVASDFSKGDPFWKARSGVASDAARIPAEAPSILPNALGGQPVLVGSKSASLAFPMQFTNEYTLIFVAKYASAAGRGRLFRSSRADQDWLSGFWNGRAGVAYRDRKWVNGSRAVPADSWVLGVDTSRVLRFNGQVFARAERPWPAPSSVVLNDPSFSENSEWMCAYVALLNYALPDEDIAAREAALFAVYGRARFSAPVNDASVYADPAPQSANIATSINMQTGLIGLYTADTLTRGTLPGANGQTTWYDTSGKGNHATVLGALTASGGLVAGTTSTSVRFPFVLEGDYTFVYVAGYMQGSTQRRAIFRSARRQDAWISGFWNGQVGVAAHNYWLTERRSAPFLEPSASVILGVDTPTGFRVNAREVSVNRPGAYVVPSSPTELVVNRPGDPANSDWTCAVIMVYARVLSPDEIARIENALVAAYATLLESVPVSRVVSACEGQKVSVSCAAGGVARGATVRYGRWDATTCPHPTVAQPVPPRFEQWQIGEDAVGKRVYELPPPTTDPYPGVHKQVQVAYGCEDTPAALHAMSAEAAAMQYVQVPYNLDASATSDLFVQTGTLNQCQLACDLTPGCVGFARDGPADVSGRCRFVRTGAVRSHAVSAGGSTWVQKLHDTPPAPHPLMVDISKTNPYAAFFGDTYDPASQTWKDVSTNANSYNMRHATVDGQVTTTTLGEHAALGGSIGTRVSFPTPPGDYTLIYVARYAGRDREAVFQSPGQPWVSGFHQGRVGYAAHGPDPITSADVVSAWLLGTDMRKRFRANGKDNTDTSKATTFLRPQKITINGDGSLYGYSQWACACVLIYDRELSEADTELVETQLTRAYGASNFSGRIGKVVGLAYLRPATAGARCTASTCTVMTIGDPPVESGGASLRIAAGGLTSTAAGAVVWTSNTPGITRVELVRDVQRSTVSVLYSTDTGVVARQTFPMSGGVQSSFVPPFAFAIDSKSISIVDSKSAPAVDLRKTPVAAIDGATCTATRCVLARTGDPPLTVRNRSTDPAMDEELNASMTPEHGLVLRRLRIRVVDQTQASSTTLWSSRSPTGTVRVALENGNGKWHLQHEAVDGTVLRRDAAAASVPVHGHPQQSIQAVKLILQSDGMLAVATTAGRVVFPLNASTVTVQDDTSSGNVWPPVAWVVLSSGREYHALPFVDVIRSLRQDVSQLETGAANPTSATVRGLPSLHDLPMSSPITLTGLNTPWTNTYAFERIDVADVQATYSDAVTSESPKRHLLLRTTDSVPSVIVVAESARSVSLNLLAQLSPVLETWTGADVSGFPTSIKTASGEELAYETLPGRDCTSGVHGLGSVRTNDATTAALSCIKNPSCAGFVSGPGAMGVPDWTLLSRMQDNGPRQNRSTRCYAVQRDVEVIERFAQKGTLHGPEATPYQVPVIPCRYVVVIRFDGNAQSVDLSDMAVFDQNGVRIADNVTPSFHPQRKQPFEDTASNDASLHAFVRLDLGGTRRVSRVVVNARHSDRMVGTSVVLTAAANSSDPSAIWHRRIWDARESYDLPVSEFRNYPDVPKHLARWWYSALPTRYVSLRRQRGKAAIRVAEVTLYDERGDVIAADSAVVAWLWPSSSHPNRGASNALTSDASRWAETGPDPAAYVMIDLRVDRLVSRVRVSSPANCTSCSLGGVTAYLTDTHNTYSYSSDLPPASSSVTIDVHTMRPGPFPKAGTLAGCYKESDTGRLLERNCPTIEHCLHLGRSLRFPYVAMQKSTECWGMSDAEIASMESAEAKKCDASRPLENAYVGCFKDQAARSLPQLLSDNVQSVDECGALARAKNLPYFGIQARRFCFGGDAGFSAYGRQDEQECRYPCGSSRGAKTAQPACGGEWTNAVYQNVAHASAYRTGFAGDPREKPWLRTVAPLSAFVESSAPVAKMAVVGYLLARTSFVPLMVLVDRGTNNDYYVVPVASVIRLFALFDVTDEECMHLITHYVAPFKQLSVNIALLPPLIHLNWTEIDAIALSRDVRFIDATTSYTFVRVDSKDPLAVVKDATILFEFPTEACVQTILFCVTRGLSLRSWILPGTRVPIRDTTGKLLAFHVYAATYPPGALSKLDVPISRTSSAEDVGAKYRTSALRMDIQDVTPPDGFVMDAGGDWSLFVYKPYVGTSFSMGDGSDSYFHFPSLANIAGGLIGMYLPESLDADALLWRDLSGNGNHARISDGVASRFTARYSMRGVVSGSSNRSQVDFPQRLSGQFTFVHFSRYSSSQKELIVSDVRGTWYSGFANGKSGHSKHGDVVFPENPAAKRNPDDWVLSVNTPSAYRANQTPSVLATGRPVFPGKVGINVVPSLRSDWSCALVMIYDRELTAREIVDLESFIFETHFEMLSPIPEDPVITCVLQKASGAFYGQCTAAGVNKQDNVDFYRAVYRDAYDNSKNYAVNAAIAGGGENVSYDEAMQSAAIMALDLAMGFIPLPGPWSIVTEVASVALNVASGPLWDKRAKPIMQHRMSSASIIADDYGTRAQCIKQVKQKVVDVLLPRYTARAFIARLKSAYSAFSLMRHATYNVHPAKIIDQVVQMSNITRLFAMVRASPLITPNTDELTKTVTTVAIANTSSPTDVLDSIQKYRDDIVASIAHFYDVMSAAIDEFENRMRKKEIERKLFTSGSMDPSLGGSLSSDPDKSIIAASHADVGLGGPDAMNDNNLMKQLSRPFTDLGYLSEAITQDGVGPEDIKIEIDGKINPKVADAAKELAAAHQINDTGIKEAAKELQGALKVDSPYVPIAVQKFKAALNKINKQDSFTNLMDLFRLDGFTPLEALTDVSDIELHFPPDDVYVSAVASDKKKYYPVTVVFDPDVAGVAEDAASQLANNWQQGSESIAKSGASPQDMNPLGQTGTITWPDLMDPRFGPESDQVSTVLVGPKPAVSEKHTPTTIINHLPPDGPSISATRVNEVVAAATIGDPVPDPNIAKELTKQAQTKPTLRSASNPANVNPLGTPRQAFQNVKPLGHPEHKTINANALDGLLQSADPQVAMLFHKRVTPDLELTVVQRVQSRIVERSLENASNGIIQFPTNVDTLLTPEQKGKLSAIKDLEIESATNILAVKVHNGSELPPASSALYAAFDPPKQVGTAAAELAKKAAKLEVLANLATKTEDLLASLAVLEAEQTAEQAAMNAQAIVRARDAAVADQAARDANARAVAVAEQAARDAKARAVAVAEQAARDANARAAAVAEQAARDAQTRGVAVARHTAEDAESRWKAALNALSPIHIEDARDTADNIRAISEMAQNANEDPSTGRVIRELQGTWNGYSTEYNKLVAKIREEDTRIAMLDEMADIDKSRKAVEKANDFSKQAREAAERALAAPTIGEAAEHLQHAKHAMENATAAARNASSTTNDALLKTMRDGLDGAMAAVNGADSKLAPIFEKHELDKKAAAQLQERKASLESRARGANAQIHFYYKDAEKFKFTGIGRTSNISDFVEHQNVLQQNIGKIKGIVDEARAQLDSAVAAAKEAGTPEASKNAKEAAATFEKITALHTESVSSLSEVIDEKFKFVNNAVDRLQAYAVNMNELVKQANDIYKNASSVKNPSVAQKVADEIKKVTESAFRNTTMNEDIRSLIGSIGDSSARGKLHKASIESSIAQYNNLMKSSEEWVSEVRSQARIVGSGLAEHMRIPESAALYEQAAKTAAEATKKSPSKLNRDLVDIQVKRADEALGKLIEHRSTFEAHGLMEGAVAKQFDDAIRRTSERVESARKHLQTADGYLATSAAQSAEIAKRAQNAASRAKDARLRYEQAPSPELKAQVERAVDDAGAAASDARIRASSTQSQSALAHSREAESWHNSASEELRQLEQSDKNKAERQRAVLLAEQEQIKALEEQRKAKAIAAAEAEARKSAELQKRKAAIDEIKRNIETLQGQAADAWSAAQDAKGKVAADAIGKAVESKSAADAASESLEGVRAKADAAFRSKIITSAQKDLIINNATRTRDAAVTFAVEAIDVAGVQLDKKGTLFKGSKDLIIPLQDKLKPLIEWKNATIEQPQRTLRTDATNLRTAIESIYYQSINSKLNYPTNLKNQIRSFKNNLQRVTDEDIVQFISDLKAEKNNLARRTAEQLENTLYSTTDSKKVDLDKLYDEISKINSDSLRELDIVPHTGTAEAVLSSNPDNKKVGGIVAVDSDTKPSAAAETLSKTAEKNVNIDRRMESARRGTALPPPKVTRAGKDNANRVLRSILPGR